MGNCIDYFYNPTVYRLSNDEIKKLKVGQIVWFIQRNGRKVIVYWGIIEHILFDGVIINLYSFNDRAKVRINGELIDYKFAPNKTDEKPLPKNWSYKTDLDIHKEYSDEINELHKNLSNADNGFFKTAESIRKLIEDKVFLPNSEIDFSYYRAVIDDRTKLYRNVKTFRSSQYEYENFQGLSRNLEWSNIFLTFEAADNEMHRIVDEWDRAGSLTDEEWAREEVAKKVTHFINLFVRIKDIDTCKEFHKMVMDEIDKLLQRKNKSWYDIEIRVFGKQLEYRLNQNVKFKSLIDTMAEEFYDGFKDRFENYLADKVS